MPKRGHHNRDGDKGGDQKSKRRKFFAASKSAALPLRTRGFLISCVGGKESQAAQESIRLLVEARSTLHPEEDAPTAPSTEGTRDLAEALQQEIDGIKDTSKDVFTYNKTGVGGLIYITMRDDAGGPGPLELAAHIAKSVRETRNAQSRTLLRFLPVERVCHASIEAIGKAAQELLPLHFPAGPSAPSLTYAVQYEHRASVNLDRDELIKKVVEDVDKVHVVNLGAPQKTIVVQVVKMCCAMSVIDDYKGNLKYNLRELAMTEEEREATRRGTSGKPGPFQKQAAEHVPEIRVLNEDDGANAGCTPEPVVVNGGEDVTGDNAKGTVDHAEEAGTLAGQAVSESQKGGTSAAEDATGTGN